jgi:hypothetical protein
MMIRLKEGGQVGKLDRSTLWRDSRQQNVYWGRMLWGLVLSLDCSVCALGRLDPLPPVEKKTPDEGFYSRMRQ